MQAQIFSVLAIVSAAMAIIVLAVPVLAGCAAFCCGISVFGAVASPNTN